MDINSPLGRRQLALKQEKERQKVFKVPDETESLDVSLSEAVEAYSTDFDNFELPTDPLPKETIAKMEARMPMVDKLSGEQLRKMKSDADKKAHLPQNVRSRLDVLLKLKKNVKTVSVEGIEFTLQTLTQSEYQEIWNDLLKNPPENQVSLSIELKVRLLAKSITHIDGQEASLVLGTSNLSEMVDIYKEFQSDVIDFLDKEYKSLKEPEVLKPDEVSEVSDQIKK